MKKSFLFSIVFTLVFCSCALSGFAQDWKDNATKQAKLFMKAYEAQNIDRILQYSDPAVVFINFGREQVAKNLRDKFANMNAAGEILNDYDIIDPVELIKTAEDEYFCIVDIIFSLKTKKLTKKSTMKFLAHSRSAGQWWNFIDMQETPPVKLEKVFPQLKDKLTPPVTPEN